MSINFSQFCCYVKNSNEGLDNREITKTDFETKDTRWHFQPDGKTNSTCYIIDMIKEEDNIFFSFEYGKPSPRRDKLVNTETFKERENNRQENEFEATEQIFVLFDFNNKFLYISNSNKKNVIEKFLSETFSLRIIIKAVLGNIQDFQKKLALCTEISLVGHNDLFFTNSEFGLGLVNLTGEDLPNMFTISLKGRKKKNWNPRHLIDKFYNMYYNRQAQGLVIKGKDDQGLDIVLNMDSFSKKLGISCEKNNEAIYEYKSVYEKLIDKIN